MKKLNAPTTIIATNKISTQISDLGKQITNQIADLKDTVKAAPNYIVYQQVAFMRNQKLGADISETLVLDGPSTQQDSAYINTFQSFRNEILQINGTKSITASAEVSK